MNRRIGKWIRIGLFAALPVGWSGLALAQSATGVSGADNEMGSPSTVSPRDRDNMLDQKDVNDDAKNSGDIHRTRGVGDQNTEVKTEDTTTIQKKKHTRHGRRDQKMQKKSSTEIKDTKDSDRLNQSGRDAREPSNIDDKSNLDEKSRLEQMRDKSNNNDLDTRDKSNRDRNDLTK